MNKEIRSYGKPVLIGADFASAPDMSAIAVRDGSHVVLCADGKRSATIERDWINDLNAGRKADREALALAFTTIAGAWGATVERRDTAAMSGYSGAGIVLRFALNGVGAMLDIDNLHGGKYALIAWFNTEYPSRDFSSKLTTGVGDYNARAHHKATSCGDDWYSIAMFLDGGLMVAARGDAFRPSA